MKVFMIGATGLLGSEAAKILLEQGHYVTSLVLPGMPPGFVKPQGLNLVYGNYLDQTDSEIQALMQGVDTFVFAAGVDERVEVPPPSYDVYVKFNNNPLAKMLSIAKANGVKRAVVCGSYFSHFSRIWPEYQMAKKHPYIKSRLEQEDIALSFADENFEVYVIEIPYVFGSQAGRKPVWTFLVQLIRSMPFATFYAKGGTTAVTARQVGQALAGATLGKGSPGPIPLGWFNITWKQMFASIHKAMGMPKRKVISVPKLFFKIGAASRMKAVEKRGLQGGLELVSFTDVMYRNCYIDKQKGAVSVGVTEDNLEQAIHDSIKLSLDILDGNSSSVEMEV